MGCIVSSPSSSSSSSPSSLPFEVKKKLTSAKGNSRRNSIQQKVPNKSRISAEGNPTGKENWPTKGDKSVSTQSPGHRKNSRHCLIKILQICQPAAGKRLGHQTKEAIWRLFCRGNQTRLMSITSSNAMIGFSSSSSPPLPGAARRTPSSSSRAKALHRFSIDTSRAKSNAPVVSFCAQKLGLREFQMAPTEEENGQQQQCDIYWHCVVYPDMKNVVKGGARVNKFPGMTELAKKISLTQAIRSMRKLFPADYGFYPRSWILPSQLAEFRQFCSTAKNADECCFIVKPDDGAQGTGIYLVNSPAELQQVEVRQLVQEYIPDPYLLPDGLKFDLRVYAVIKSINPLSIYVAREGMARFCTEKYVGKPNRHNFGNLYAHLTNYSLNKANNAYVHSKSLKEQLKGSKRLLSTVFHQMEHKGVRTRRLWKDIKLIIVKTVLAMVPEMMLSYEREFSDVKGPAPQCFQIMGFDILVRKDGSPVLLEVNSSPSLSVEHSLGMAQNGDPSVSSSSPNAAAADEDQSPAMRSIVDEMIKVPLVRDSILLVLDQLEQYYPPEQLAKEREDNSRNKAGIGTGTPLGARNKWDIQSLDSISTNVTTSGTTTCPSILPFASSRVGTSQDDFGLLKRQKRPHLSEVFPARYGQASRQFLVLDRAVYLYLQFVSIRQTQLISLPTIRAFLRKCELANLLKGNSLEDKFNEVNAYFNSSETKTTVASGAPALPFHGFLQILFHLARLKFPSSIGEDGTAASVFAPFIRLLSHCDSALRRYGVRSTRLRRAELFDENDQPGNENENRTDCRQKPALKIYLLPSRIAASSSCGPMVARKPLEPTTKMPPQQEQQENLGGQNQRRKTIMNGKMLNARAKSLPRKMNVMPSTTYANANANNTNKLSI